MTKPDDVLIDPESGVEERPQNRREWAGPARSIVLPLLIVATIVGILVYIDRRGDGGAIDDGFGVVTLPDDRNPTGRSPSTDVGRTPPDFLLRTLEGGELRFSDLRGSPVLVNFWASWCTPCRQEMPHIVRAYDERRDDGLVVVAVDLQENDDVVREFAEDFGMEFPIVIDRTGEVGDAWRIGGPVEGIPSSYFIDAEGIVQARVFGPMDEERLAEELEKIIR
jgi:thiol-disulfide isomerase/thioredoxin